jgi:hypothetical protein
MANSQNLKPFKPGQSGNPGGKLRAFIQYRNEVEADLVASGETLHEDGRTLSRVATDRLIADACAGKAAQQRIYFALVAPVQVEVDVASRVEIAPVQEDEWAALVVDLTRLTDSALDELKTENKGTRIKLLAPLVRAPPLGGESD